MTLAHLSLPPQLLAKAFPFHFVFNRELEIVQAGEVLQRVMPLPLVGSRTEQHFQITRPRVASTFEAIQKNTRSLFLLDCYHNQIHLKGQMLYVEEQDVIFFLGSPWLTDPAQLSPLGLKLKDFAIHDPIVDFLFLLQAQNAALAETKSLTEELTKQREQLQSALRIKENLAKIAEAQAGELKQTLRQLQATQTQLVQAEKMSSLGQLVAGIAHEINNPVNFIHGNLKYTDDYVRDLIDLLHLYHRTYPEPHPDIQKQAKAIELDFLVQDLSKVISSMKTGADRIREIVLSLRNFSRLDEAEMKTVNVHEGIESTLLILRNRFKSTSKQAEIKVIKDYGDIPLVECYAGQLNQVFMNIISNAIDAIEEHQEKLEKVNALSHQKKTNTIRITTELNEENFVTIRIADDGPGIPQEICDRIFDPFFTTKPVGKGTGLGLSISYQIITERHQGTLLCSSHPGQGTEFYIAIPLIQTQEHQTVEDIVPQLIECVA